MILFAKSIRLFVLNLFIVLIISLNVKAQTFKVDTIVYNGDPSKFINIVFMGDGYQNNELSTYISDVQNSSNYLFSISPFLEYKNYFNVFAISVPSLQSGASHPRTAPDCPPVADHPFLSVNTYFNSTFDVAFIYRLLVATNYSAINMVLVNNFPIYDQNLIIANTPYYGGSGGGTPVASKDKNSLDIIVHEFGHSFAHLWDEYWISDTYAIEKTNMTKETNPALVKWKNWIGVNGVGIYQHCCGESSALWYRPHENCKMRNLGNDFCPVCKEAIAQTILHKFGSPVQSFQPNASVISVCSNLMPFKVSLYKPTPNTIRTKWILNGVNFAMNTESLTINVEQLKIGNNSLSVQFLDTTKLIRDESHPINHTNIINWTLIRNQLPSLGTITGTAIVCPGQNSVIYTVPMITNATSYIWTLPPGATGTSNTNSISANFGTSAVSGNIKVKGNNDCGDGSISSLEITVNPLPSNAGTITGTATVCQGQNTVTYTVPSITNATSYIWTLPIGATGTSTSNSITVNYGNSTVTGNISV